MFVLDCSSSLANDFYRVQSYAKEFIRILKEHSVNTTEVESVRLDRTDMVLSVGETYNLQASVYPTTALLQTVEWSSSNPLVATVDSKGCVTAKASGNATITARTVDGGHTASCDVSVVRLATDIKIDKTSTIVYMGETEMLQADVSPENVSNRTVSWSSSAPSVATVDGNGLITPVAPGKTIVSVSTCDGSGLEATCEVTVLQHVESLELSSETLTLDNGMTSQLQATVFPVNASDKTLTWESSDPEVASVDDKGNVTAKSRGETVITVMSVEGGVSAKCSVVVRQQATGIVMNHEFLEIYNGESGSLTAAVYPDNANDRTVSWSSSAPSVATVDGNGLITPIAPGKTIISGSTCDGSGLTATCEVTVLQHVESLELSPETLTLDNGTTSQLQATVFPANASDKTLTWESSAPEVASVDDNGNVYAKMPGTTEIIVKSVESGVAASCKVRVVILASDIYLDESSLELNSGSGFTLAATIMPYSVTTKNLKWESSNNDIATVDSEGNINAVAFGKAIITAYTTDGSNLSASCEIYVSEPDHGYINKYEFIDLGLPSGLKWASMNIGAESPTESGSYFAWGEISTKNSYISSNSKTYNMTFSDISGDSKYDAATANMKGSWRMPTFEEYNELSDNCVWSYISVNGQTGYSIKGPNGNSIFLPTSGYMSDTSLMSVGSMGYYWSSTPYEKYTYALGINSDSHLITFYYRYRYYGLPIRAVAD